MIRVFKWSQRWGSNPQPAVYKTAALPLSYFGERSEPKTTAFGERSEPKTTAFGERSEPKTTAFGERSEPKTTAFGKRHISPAA